MRALLLVLALAPAARAAEPRLLVDRDLAAELGPVRDQKDIGWCYANATADMLGWRYRAAEPVSAAHVALLRNRSTRRPADAESGALSWAIYSYGRFNPNGLCKASALEGFVFPRLRATLPRLGGYQDVFALLRGLRAAIGSADRAGAEAAAARALAALGLGYPTPAFVDFLSSASANDDRAAALAQGLGDRLCARGGYMPASPRLSARDLDVDVAVHANAGLDQVRRAIGTHLGVRVPDWNLRHFPRTVRAEIEAGRPVAFAYSSGFLNDASKGFSYDDLHASVIVAVRCQEGRQCIYKVRNSWGARCSYRNPAVQATCLPNPGHFWLSETQLNQYGSSMVRFRTPR